MSVVRHSAFAATAALLLGLGTAGVASATPDPAYPTGTFTVSPPSTWVVRLPSNEADIARFTISGHAADDVTPEADIIRTVTAGDGTPPRAWTGSGDFALTYDGPGTFSPQVTLTDSDAHVTTIDLPAVTALRDEVSPLLLVDPPARRLAHRVAGWRVVHVTAADYESGIAKDNVEIGVMQFRHHRWYLYSFSTRKWTKQAKGTSRDTALYYLHVSHRPRMTFGIKARPDHYRTPRIAGLGKGVLVVEAWASDRSSCFTHRLRTVRLRRY